MTTITRMTCEECGGEDITCDADAAWSAIRGRWELVTTYDKATCRGCNASVNYIPVTRELSEAVDHAEGPHDNPHSRPRGQDHEGEGGPDQGRTDPAGVAPEVVDFGTIPGAAVPGGDPGAAMVGREGRADRDSVWDGFTSSFPIFYSEPELDLIAAAKRALPWLARMIAMGQHRECVAPLDAENTYRQLEAAIVAIQKLNG
jgi:hypothetical protein